MSDKLHFTLEEAESDGFDHLHSAIRGPLREFLDSGFDIHEVGPNFFAGIIPEDMPPLTFIYRVAGTYEDLEFELVDREGHPSFVARVR